jgi:ectoine hydroxylase-related dioxygenase (phytanoyl-CoA dioxygenase family)
MARGYPGAFGRKWNSPWLLVPLGLLFLAPFVDLRRPLRLLHLDLLERGACAQELSQWLWGAHWFPHLNYHEKITTLERALPPAWRTGTLCDPQILLQFPHVGPEPEITFHVDEEPHWAQGRCYRRIVGVPLSPGNRDNGGLVVWPFGGDEPEPVEVEPGDVIVMHPALPHTSGLNRGGAIRYAVYFRFLEPRSG